MNISSVIISPEMSRPISARRNIGDRSGMAEENFQPTTPAEVSEQLFSRIEKKFGL